MLTDIIFAAIVFTLAHYGMIEVTPSDWYSRLQDWFNYE